MNVVDNLNIMISGILVGMMIFLRLPDIGVRELVGRVRNVVLMNVYWDLENPGGS
jgi:hypothetical protein